MVEIFKLNLNEKEEKKDVWPELYAAFQNELVLKGTVFGVEEHKLGRKKRLAMVIMFDGIKGIIPMQETGIPGADEEKFDKKQLALIRNKMLTFVGQTEPALVKEILREDETVILSRKSAMDLLAKITWSKVQKGKVVVGKVRETKIKKAIVEVGGITLAVPNEELSWGFVKDSRMLFTEGQPIKLKVMDIDQKNKEMVVSHKETMANPWPNCTKKYLKNNLYLGRVTGIIDKAVFAKLEPGVDVYCKHMKFERVEVGDPVVVRIEGIDPVKRYIWGGLNGHAERASN